MVERKSYRPAQPAAPARREESRTTPYPSKKQEYDGGGGGTYVNISGLFPSKSGKADKVLVDEKIADALHNVQPGDTIGVSVNKTGRLSLWYIANSGGNE